MQIIVKKKNIFIEKLMEIKKNSLKLNNGKYGKCN